MHISTLVSRGRIKNRDLWESLTPEVRDSRTSLTLEASLTIWLAENTERLLSAFSKNWTFPEVGILGAGQKEPGLWVQNWTNKLKMFMFGTKV